MHNGQGASHPTSNLPNLRTFLVCGMTGVGKSTFIQKVTGAEISASDGIDSDTVDVIEAGIPLVQANNEYIQLVDTPGFGDSREDNETVILRRITTWLSARYLRGVPVTGVIFLRPMHIVRVNNLEKKLMAMLKDLCGPGCLDHIFLITTRWTSRMTDAHRRCELEIQSREDCFGSSGAERVQVRRLNDNYSSEEAQRLVHSLAGLSPVIFQIQREIVDEDKELGRTRAGIRIGADLDEKIAGLEEKARKSSQYAADAMRKLKEAELAKIKLEEERYQMEQQVRQAAEAARQAQQATEIVNAQLKKALKESEDRIEAARVEAKSDMGRSENERRKADEKIRQLEAEAGGARYRYERDWDEANEMARKANEETKAALKNLADTQNELDTKKSALASTAQEYKKKYEEATQSNQKTLDEIKGLKERVGELQRPVKSGTDWGVAVAAGFAVLPHLLRMI